MAKRVFDHYVPMIDYPADPEEIPVEPIGFINIGAPTSVKEDKAVALVNNIHNRINEFRQLLFKLEEDRFEDKRLYVEKSIDENTFFKRECLYEDRRMDILEHLYFLRKTQAYCIPPI